MESGQDNKQDVKAKAERLSPVDELGPDELEELAGDAAALIHSGHVQYWRANDTTAVFTLSVLENVWQMQVFFAGAVDDENWCPDEELKTALSAFWDSEKPEYITTVTPTTWPNLWLMQMVGFRQIGTMPLPDGPAITCGWVEAVAEVNAANNEAARLCAISEAAGQNPCPADKDFEVRVIEPAYDRLTAIEDEITDLEARCGEDLAVKVAVTHRVRGVWCDVQIDGLVSDANKLLERA
ncbi:hypothetical protein [Ruegeria sp. HKCCD8929]|uniref:hypothetical protein n=1 Tax=Ruegeria sp. HKCCD8929 TaxID=2683006 RepID=UPI001488E3F8|nr:hypothetical protein [Ruegeria sp. HKCCD8929]